MIFPSSSSWNAVKLFLVLVGFANLLIVAPAKADATRHQALNTVVAEHVDAGWVDYPAIASDQRFTDYLKTIEALDAQTLADPNERLSFWINAYNALAIKGILDGNSPSSFFGRIAYFGGATYSVGGKTLNLYDLEHDMIIPAGEPRSHFAINCASKSCPALRSNAYVGDTLNQDLDHAAREFVNNTALNRFERAAKVAYLSKIFDWYSDEFGKDEQGVLTYIAGFVADDGLAVQLRAGDWRIEYLDYDWSLNGIAPVQ